MYPVLKSIHLLAVFILMGGSAIGGLVPRLARQSVSTAHLKVVATVAQTAPKLTIPGSIIAMLTGTGLIAKLGFSWTQPWVIASYTLWFIAMGISGAVLGRKMRAAGPLLGKAIASGAAEAPEFQAALTDPAIRIATGILHGVSFTLMLLMVFKPGM